ncbi:monoheme c-type cytochrome [Aliarcobacter faecis]|uniref:c-type cytochrome n=1 Tax=Aliarcobacter faecis TaxID=1564138 RepID=UPI00047DE0CA|nr:hypothetical protein [Aliarcobacter faecis]QKF73089.1 monoheme c-type cytochrome [Aliarcobacter faecis]
MKKILISLLIASLFIACSDNKKEKELKNEQTKEQVKTTSNQKITITENNTTIEKENPFISYDLDGNRVVRISPDGEETALTKELGALISIKNSYEKLNAKILSQRLSKNYMQKCSACHDNYANGVIGPSLLDKSEDEIFQAIKVYQTGEKKNVLMKDLISKMPDSEIRSLASEIAQLNKEVRENK